jgi:hypothetical protein
LVAPESFGRHEVSISPLFPVIAVTAAISPSGVEIYLASRNILVPLVWALQQALVWLQLPPPSVVELPDVTSLLPRVPRDSSIQHGQSVATGSVAEVLGVIRRLISRLVEGRCPVCHGKILRISVRKGRCQYLEVRTAKDREMLMMINAYTYVV